MYRVVQTAEAFKYPVGKAWGPYVAQCDADAQVAKIRGHGGDAVIEDGEYGVPCSQGEPAGVGGPSMARELVDA